MDRGPAWAPVFHHHDPDGAEARRVTRYTLTVLGADHQHLVEHLRSSTNELAAFIHARVVVMGDEVRLLVRAIEPVAAADIETSSAVHLSILSRAYVHSIKRSRIRECAFGFVHSHPTGPAAFSPQDDQEEPELFRLAHSRNPQAVHFSLVAANDAASLIGRVWHPDGTTSPIDLVRVIGDYWDFTYADEASAPRPFFARQVLALGSEIQSTLERLHMGVVGVGGTGSAIVEQLIRLGCGSYHARRSRPLRRLEREPCLRLEHVRSRSAEGHDRRSAKRTHRAGYAVRAGGRACRQAKRRKKATRVRRHLRLY